jgi:3-hydroxyacyl-CoA dehydrogenase
MNMQERLENVAVVGAAGKMGSGISLLLAGEMARMKLTPDGSGRTFRLSVIDRDHKVLDGLLEYLRLQLVKVGEKRAGELRELYADRADLVENRDMIEAYVGHALAVLRPATDLNGAAGATLIFEAVSEDEDLKVNLLSQVREVAHPEAWYLTNTSSIPIENLSHRVRLQGRMVGYHFYNPPAVQKLVEYITCADTLTELIEGGYDLAERLGKKVIPANDIAGFIGNGHFIRDGLHAIATADRLRGGGNWAPALYKVNRVSQDWLLRPMGIWQLIDYVGVDVFKSILDVMNRYLPGQGLQSEFIDALIERHVLGGQNPDGSQKDGILRYAKGRPVAVYDLTHQDYAPFDSEGWTGKADQELGPLPEGFRPWKQLLAAKDRAEALAAHFQTLASTDSDGARLALEYLKASKEIGQKLVDDGVAADAGDVNGVLTNGFFHLHGPINNYVA